MKDYSQYGEQDMILAALKAEGGYGSFLDIGAYHPTDKSNTRALFELGFAGVMIEAAPGPMRALLAEYGNEEQITLVQAAVGLEPGLLPMWVTDDAVSTSDAQEHERWKSRGGYLGKILVPTLTLPQISNQFGGFTFISIDTEGNSCELFLKALGLGWRPRCWCVEIDRGREHEVMAAATKAGYTVQSTEANFVMVQK